MKKMFISALFACLASVVLFTGNTSGGTPWQVIENCHLLDALTNDGDTFQVEHEGATYTFRLYFVDAPEIREDLTDRVDEQAEYFGISHDRTLEIGRSAASFTAQQLRDHFTVITRWENAHGRGKTSRYLAFVIANGQDLGEALVQNGLARLVGERTVSPSGRTARAVGQSLLTMEDQAKLNHIGGWSTGNFKISTHAAMGTDQTHRMSISNGDRHNSHCPLFNSEGTRPCAPDEGHTCPVCGG